MTYTKLEVAGPDGESVLVSVNKDVFTLGRGAGNDLVLDDQCHARRHVEIGRVDFIVMEHIERETFAERVS